jgi:hypothetical protein
MSFRPVGDRSGRLFQSIPLTWLNKKNLYMVFPVILIKDKDPSIYFFDNKTFRLVSKGQEKFYKSGVVYDSNGDVYKLIRINGVRNAPFLSSIRFFQPMKLVDIEFELVDRINLLQLKGIVTSHVNSHNKYWEKRDLIHDLVSQIMNIESAEKLFKFLK